jgi:hypothetical protein
VALEEEEDKLWQLNYNSAMEEDEDNFALLGGGFLLQRQDEICRLDCLTLET